MNSSAPVSVLRGGLLLVGTALLLVGGLATSQYRKATALGPLFVEPFSLAVDRAGNIYCGVELERVHKYSPEGDMIGAWSVDAGLQPFRLRVGPNQTVEAATANGKLVRFDAAGKTLSTEIDADAFERFGAANDLEIEAPSGVRYAIQAGGLVRGEAGSERPWKPAPGWPLRWIRTPVPLALLLVSGPIAMLAGVALQRGPREADEGHGAADG